MPVLAILHGEERQIVGELRTSMYVPGVPPSAPTAATRTRVVPVLSSASHPLCIRALVLVRVSACGIAWYT